MHCHRIGMKVSRAIWFSHLVHLWDVRDHREDGPYGSYYLSIHFNAMTIVYIPL